MCTFQRMLCTFHRSCALFTSPLVMFVFNCIGATKHVLPCIIYIRIYIFFFIMMLYGSWWVIWPKNCVNHPTTDQPYKLGEKFDQFGKILSKWVVLGGLTLVSFLLASSNAALFLVCCLLAGLLQARLQRDITCQTNADRLKDKKKRI